MQYQYELEVTLRKGEVGACKMNVHLLQQFILEVCLGHNCLTEYPVALKLCRTTLGCPRIIFGKVGKCFCFVKFDTTMPLWSTLPN